MVEESNCERDHQAHVQEDSASDYRCVPVLRFRGFTYAWERRKLDETVSFYSGLTYSPSDICDAGGTLVLRSSNVQSGELAFVDNVYVNDSVASSEQVRKNDLIVVVRNGSRALLGKHAIIRDDMPKTVIGAFMTGIRSDEQEFMNALMSSRAFESEINKNLGATINQITGGMFAEMTFSMPDESEQHAIGSLFFKLDSLVTLHQRKLNKLHHIKKALLEKMFPTPGSTIPEIRFQGFTETWKQQRLGEVGKARSGVGFPDIEQGGTTGIPFFKVSDMNLDSNENEMTVANNYVTADKIAAYRWSPITELPAIFFAKVGAAVMLNRKRLCRFPFLLDNNTMAYSLSSTKWDANFAKALFETVDLTSLIQLGALPSYNAEDVESMEIYLPEVLEQKKIGAYFSALDSLVALHQHKLNKLHCIKKALLEKMFV